MSNYLMNWWWGGNPDEPIPTSNLTLRDVHHIQRSWKPIHANAIENGVELFLRMFRKDPETKGYFKQFKDMHETELPQNKKFRAHVINFMSAFNTAISHLLEPEVVAAMITKLGESHKKHQITGKHFQCLKDVLLEFLIIDLSLNESIIASWIKFIEFIYQYIHEENIDRTLTQL